MISDTRADGTYTFTYNAAGRMASVSKDGVLQAEYVYNWLGQQKVQKLYAGGVLSQTIYVIHDPQFGNRLAEYDGDTGALLREYVWMGDTPVAVVENGQTSYVRTDHIGRPVYASRK